MAQQDYYKVLDVERGASQDEIRKAYKKLSKKYHPDGETPQVEKFKQVQEAFDVLGDAEKRQQYDRFGHAFRGAPGGGDGPQGQTFHWSTGSGGVDLGDLFGNVDLGDLFGAGFRGAGPRPQRGRHGGDVQVSLEIPFETSALGGTHDLRFRGETLSVKIPPGVDTGSVIRLGGQGEPGVGQGARPGDLLITLHVQPHRWFRRDGNNVLLDLPVTVSEAVLGTKVDVPTLDEGKITLTVPPGTSSGAKLRLRGKGIPDRQTKERGDLLVVVKIVVPAKPSARVKELMQELAEAAPANPRADLWP
jgi:DnaJ-class molecular chaperone